MSGKSGGGGGSSSSSNPPTPEQIDDMISAGTDPANTPGANWGVLEGLSNSEVQKEDISNEIQSITGATQSPATVAIEDFKTVAFADMCNTFDSASGTLDNGNGAAWQQIAGNIIEASQQFQQSLAAQEAQKEWVGKTHQAAMANITQSLPDLATTASGANALGLLINAFAHTIFQTRWYLVSNLEPYQDSLGRWPNERDLINQAYNSYAQDVMNTVYAPNIATIASNNPGFPSSSSSSQNNPASNPPPPGDPNSDNNPPPPPPGFDDSDSNPPPPPPDFNAPPPPSGLDSGPNTNGPSSNLPPNPLDNLPNGDDVGDGSGDPFPGSNGGALPNGAGITNPLSGSANPFGGSANSPTGLGGPTAPNGTGTSDPFSGTGIGNPLSGSGNPLSGSGSPATGSAGSGLSSALGQATDGLQQPLQQALGAAQNRQGGAPGAGAPNLDPKGLDASAKPGGGPGQAGGGGGAGIGSQGRDTLAPAGAPVAAASKGTDNPSSALSRPGAPAGAGGSPGGAPGGGGGQRGSTSKEHKANKALRRKKNGELVIGEVDAVVPVIGDDGPDEAEPPQRAPAPAAPQVPRPPAVSSPRRPVFEQRAEVGR